MSRIGRAKIIIPQNVKVEYTNNIVKVVGPLGELSRKIESNLITIKIEDNILQVERKNDDKLARSLHGLYRALINNMVLGVQNKFSKSLKVDGVGYKCNVQGLKLVMNIGYSHPAEVNIPKDIELTCPTQTEIVVKGISKEQVGQFAAEIKSKKPVEPYHLYGIRYSDEVISKKEGKKAGK